MKQPAFHKKYVIPACLSVLAVFGIVLYVFLRPAAEEASAGTYDISDVVQGPLTEEEKQETYQAYLKEVLTEDIRNFCGENVSVDPVYNEERELEGVILAVDASAGLEEETELQIIKTVSTAYGLQPDRVSFTYR